MHRISTVLGWIQESRRTLRADTTFHGKYSGKLRSERHHVQ